LTDATFLHQVREEGKSNSFVNPMPIEVVQWPEVSLQNPTKERANALLKIDSLSLTVIPSPQSPHNPMDSTYAEKPTTNISRCGNRWAKRMRSQTSSSGLVSCLLHYLPSERGKQ
jgi:hypothetical protein